MERMAQVLVCDAAWGGTHSSQDTIELPGLLTQVLCIPCDGHSKGGDLYYITTCDSHTLSRLVLIDCIGHGAEANPLSESLLGLVKEYRNNPDDSQVLQMLNSALLGMGMDGKFATAVVSTYNQSSHTFTFAYAGHPPILARRGLKWSKLDGDRGNSYPIGMVNHKEYYQSSIKLDEGDRLMIYSDALLEVGGTVENLVRIVEESTLDAMQKSFDALIKSLERLNGGPDFSDDLTVMIVERTG